MPPQNKLLTSKLAAFIGIAHIEINDYLDDEAERAASVVDKFAYEIAQLDKNLPAYMVEHEVRKLCERLPNAIGKSLYDSLMEVGQVSTQQIVKALVKGVPMEYMPVEVLTQEAWSGGALLKAIIKPFKTKPPVVKLDKPTLKSRFHNLLIEPIKKHVLEKIVLGGAAAISKLMTWTKTTLNPKRIADIFVKGISSGKNRREIARELQQELGATKAQAKRLARTEGIRVATESNLMAYDELGDAVLGFMIHAVLDERTRPQHRIRNGWVYYKEPEEGQRSIQDMPKPPIEPDGSVAWNCRCYLSPVFANLENLDKTKFIHNTNLLPDPLVYQDWWKTATDRQKRIAVGSRRYDAVTKKHGKTASYFHFIDDNGDLLSLDAIATETPADTQTRIMRLRTIMGQARLQRRDALLFGSV